MRVLGIDPGLRITGYACLEGVSGVAALTTIPRIVEAGVFRLGKSVDPKAKAARLNEKDSTGAIDLASGLRRLATGKAPVASISARLLELDRDFTDLIQRVAPDAVAIEAIFAHTNHPATSIIMAHARGVLLLGARKASLRLVELRPATVKKALTGNGQADKAHMQRAVQERFGLAELPSPPDLADALAIALCAIERLGWSSGRE